jgi:hypothetical protein
LTLDLVVSVFSVDNSEVVPTVPMLPLAPVVAFGHLKEDRKVKNVVSLQDDVGVKPGVYLGVE